jgi:hypothetical protein
MGLILAIRSLRRLRNIDSVDHRMTTDALYFTTGLKDCLNGVLKKSPPDWPRPNSRVTRGHLSANHLLWLSLSGITFSAPARLTKQLCFRTCEKGR